MKKQWFQNNKRIISNGKRILCDECPCGYNCNIPTPAVEYSVPGDYATLTAALTAHGSESTTRINITGTHSDVLPFFNCQIYGSGTENTTLTGGCSSSTNYGTIIKTKITTAAVWKCKFAYCEITDINPASVDIIIGNICGCEMYNCSTSIKPAVSDWNAGNGGDISLGNVSGCKIYDCSTSKGGDGLSWVPGYTGSYGQRGGLGGNFKTGTILDSEIYNITSGNGGDGFKDGLYWAEGNNAGDIEFACVNSSIKNITSGNGGNGCIGGNIIFSSLSNCIVEDIISGNGGIGYNDNFNRQAGDGGSVRLDSVSKSSITRLTTGSGGTGTISTKPNQYGRYDGGSDGGYGGDISSYNYSISDSIFDSITVGCGGNGGDWSGVSGSSTSAGKGGRAGYFRFRYITNSIFTNINFGNGGNGGNAGGDDYINRGGTGGSFVAREYSSTMWYAAYIYGSTFTNISFGNGGSCGTYSIRGGAGGGGFCQGGAGGGANGGNARFDIEGHFSTASPVIHYRGINIFNNIIFGQPGASGSLGGSGKAGGFGYNGGNGGSSITEGVAGGDGANGGTYYVEGDTTGWPVPQGGAGGSGDPSGTNGTIGQVISE